MDKLIYYSQIDMRDLFPSLLSSLPKSHLRTISLNPPTYFIFDTHFRQNLVFSYFG